MVEEVHRREVIHPVVVHLQRLTAQAEDVQQDHAVARHEGEEDAPGTEDLAGGRRGRYAAKCILIAVFRADAPRR